MHGTQNGVQLVDDLDGAGLDATGESVTFGMPHATSCPDQEHSPSDTLSCDLGSGWRRTRLAEAAEEAVDAFVIETRLRGIRFRPERGAVADAVAVPVGDDHSQHHPP